MWSADEPGRVMACMYSTVRAALSGCLVQIHCPIQTDGSLHKSLAHQTAAGAQSWLIIKDPDGRSAPKRSSQACNFSSRFHVISQISFFNIFWLLLLLADYNKTTFFRMFVFALLAEFESGLPGQTVRMICPVCDLIESLLFKEWQMKGLKWAGRTDTGFLSLWWAGGWGLDLFAGCWFVECKGCHKDPSTS